MQLYIKISSNVYGLRLLAAGEYKNCLSGIEHHVGTNSHQLVMDKIYNKCLISIEDKIDYLIQVVSNNKTL